MKFRNVDWVLKIDEDNEFYLHLKDISGRLPPNPSFYPRLVEDEQFDFLRIPPEIQLMVLRHLPSSDLGSCRLTCRFLDRLIKGNWNNLKPRNIGVVEFTPGGDVGCLKGFIRFYYKRKLESFNNVVIFVLISFYGEFTIPRIQSLTQILNQSRISIKKIVICNTPCSCELEHLIALIENAHAECLIIDVCGRIDLGKKLAKDPVVKRLQGVLIYSNGDEASYFTAKTFIDYESFSLADMREVMEVSFCHI
ncbi:unnamed protein product [Cylicocyclus nassatus]|uniref:F-box domain-containing protein n=1 Tax=Cylicocyclus nassatus TaxID=53992 RepID=A0AA36GSV4_CYLNA|nr:unnamed protein product [Cylicocyclus nassatus]